MADTVVSLESILVDVVVEVPGLPVRGGDVLATRTRTHPGGGFNLAAAVARQDVPCVYAAPHGTGPYGDLVRGALAAEGVEALAKRRAEGDTGFCVTFVEPDGERTFVTVAGVEAALCADDLAALRPGPGDVLAVSGYDLAYPVSGPILGDWLAALPGHCRIALDPGPLLTEIPRDRLSTVLGRLWLLTLNQREARLLTGAAGAHGRALLAAVRGTGIAGSALVVLREGAHGCVAAGGPLGDTTLSVPAPQVEAVDLTGAGDAHTGVLLAGLISGEPVEQALATATRAAAIAVTRRGPATTPARAELRGL